MQVIISSASFSDYKYKLFSQMTQEKCVSFHQE